jgi:DNA repair protein SbcC/Rad50
MRILRISLRNIASLAGTHTIDFTRDPLRATGLFSISGPTGSGKSTVLDALCLALFEKTPRLDAVRGATKLPDGGEFISQSDPSNLLRRGCGEGFAEVAFIGVDSTSYTARWEVRRAHNRSGGALQKTELMLLRGDVRSDARGVIEEGGKKSEVLPAIASKVGLSFDQFTRAVLLAQNQFAIFLKADDRERAAILQALTGTEHFDEISRSVFERCSTKKKEIEALENRLQGNSPMESDRRAEAESALINAERAREEATENLTARQKHAAWYQDLGKLGDDVASAQRSVDEAKRQRSLGAARRIELNQTERVSREARPLWDAECRLSCEAAALKESRDQAANTEANAGIALRVCKEKYKALDSTFAAARSAAETAQPKLRLARELDARLRFLAGQLATTTRDREKAEMVIQQLSKRRDCLIRERQNAATEIHSLSERRESLAWLAPFAPDAAGWLARIDQAIAAHAANAEIDRDLMQRAAAEQKKRNFWETERAKEPGLRAEAAAAISNFVKAERSARSYDGEKISAERREAELTRSALCKLQNHLARLEWLSNQAQAVDDELHSLKIENQVDSRTLLELREHRIPAAETALKCARQSFELAQTAVADPAVRMREKLVSGLHCPVCGSSEHPYAKHPPSTEVIALRALRDDCITKESELTALRNKEAGLTLVCQAREAQVREKSRSLREIASELEMVSAIRHEHPEAAALAAMPAAEKSTTLIDRIAAQGRLIEYLDARDEARLAIEKQRDLCRTLRDEALQNMATLEKHLAEVAGELGRIQAGREAAESLRNKAAGTLKNCLQQLAPLSKSRSHLLPEWEQDKAAFRENFCAGIFEFQALERRAKELDSVVRERSAALIPGQEALDLADAECKSKRAAEAAARSACDKAAAERVAVFDGRPVETVEIEINQNLNAAAKNRDDCAEKVLRAEKDFIIASQELKTASNVHEEIHIRHKTAVAGLDSWLAAFAKGSGRILNRAGLNVMLSRDAAWIETERASLDALETAVSKAEGALAVHRRAFGAHVASRPTMDNEIKIEADVVRLRSALKEAEQRHDLARTMVQADDQLRAARVDLVRELESRTERFKPWERLNELIGSADGAKFRSIAQRRTLDVLLRFANVQLDQLSGRYSLARIPESLNLIVLDRDMGDERRSVHTLSGGESFLVSLALALGLASLTANRLRIESLFIDEGFGSLDPETMNIAMGALMSLEAQGRKVGVISHIPEMADAIPVQIRVVKGRNGASRIIVPGAPF